MTDEELIESENVRLIVSNDLGDIVTTYTIIVDKVLGSDGPNGTDILDLSNLVPQFRQKFICTVCDELLSAEFYRTEHCLHFVCAGCRDNEREEDKECKYCKDWDNYSICETGDSSLCLVLRGYKKFCAYFIQSTECRRMLEIKTEVDTSFDGESLAIILKEAALKDYKEDPPAPLIPNEPQLAPLIKTNKRRTNPLFSNSSDDLDLNNDFDGFLYEKPKKSTQSISTQTPKMEEPCTFTGPVLVPLQKGPNSGKDSKETNGAILQPVVRLSNLGTNCIINESILKSLKPSSTTSAIVNGVKKKITVIRSQGMQKIDFSSGNSGLLASLKIPSSTSNVLATEKAATATTPAIINLKSQASSSASSSSSPVSSSSIFGTVVPKQEGLNKKLKVRLPKGKVSPKRGCRCGNASTVPGKLTCCGQRCPCYVDAKACLDCRCKGCRNPHLPGGRKLLQGINAVIDTRTNKTVTLAPHPITISNSLPSVSVVSSSQLCQITSQGQHFTPIYPMGTVANFGGISIPLPILSMSHTTTVPTMHHNNGTQFTSDLSIKPDPHHYEL